VELQQAMAGVRAPGVWRTRGEKNVLKEDLLEAVLERSNLQAAYLTVKGNKGAAGIDGIGTEDLGEHLCAHWVGIRAKLLEGRYKPSPVRPVAIAKPGGGERQLGIPTTLDRLIQQALQQVLSGILDPTFSTASYGYRPGRSAHDAIRQARHHVVEEQRGWVVDIDIERFFDTIDHDLLMRDLSQHVADKRVLALVGRILRAGVLQDGRIIRSAKGTPQGGPLSPLLANLYLDRLDKELERRGVAFVRYADDVTLYARSERSAQRIYENIVPWIEKHLKLRVNTHKSGTRPPDAGSFLGFVIEADGQIGISQKSLQRFKAQVRLLWDARYGLSGRERIAAWQQYVTGWWTYYRLCDARRAVFRLGGWIRRHIRKFMWQRWHSWRGRHNALRRLGARGPKLALAHSTRGAWRAAVALNPILNNDRLRRWGLYTPEDLAAADSS
jgi:group II intron reverse transcriptase/maturase